MAERRENIVVVCAYCILCEYRFEKWAELFGQTIYAVSAKATALTDLQTVRQHHIISSGFAMASPHP